MARSIDTIQTEILTDVDASGTLSPLLTSSSRASRFRLFSYIVSAGMWVLEKLFDTHKSEVDNKLLNQKAGTLNWIATMALSFQYGYDLVPDHDYYDNTGLTADQVAASKIVKYVAVSQSENESRVIIKIKGADAPLNADEQASFVAYMKEVLWPVKRNIVNYLPDILNISLKIKYNALVLNANGMSILNGNYPVEEALYEFIANELAFNGELRLSALVDKLQKAEGVVDATLISASSSWIDPESNSYGDAQEIYITTIAQSGSFVIGGLGIEYYT
jgi:hypothetical protein